MVHKRNNKNLEMEIMLLLLRGECHLRGIAKSLDESHSTVMRKLNRMVRENVLDFKVEGKNKVFFIKKNLQAKNYVSNAERYKLIKLLKKYPEMNVIINDVLKKIDESLIILFGSYTKFAAKENSDIDIYIETRSRRVKEEAESINSRIRAKIGSFDMHSYLIKEIIKDHIIIRGVEDFYEKTRFFG